MSMVEIRKIKAAHNFEALWGFKDEGYNMLVDITAVDYSTYPGEKRLERFDVVYRVMKLDIKTGMDQGRVEIHCAVGEGPVLRSVLSLWPAADWLEREVWDMFGIRFADRPDIKRLLMYEEFTGHPLRKNYPMAKRQPLIGPPSGEPEPNPSFNAILPRLKGE